MLGTCAHPGAWYNDRVRPLCLVFAVACSSGTPKPAATAPPVPNDVEAVSQKGCAEAASGIEQGTRGVREPGVSVLSAMRAQCVEEVWPAVAIECFAAMQEGDLGRCAGELAPKSRDRLFATLGGGFDDRTAIAIAQARLHQLKVGVLECDNFVLAVQRALGCEGMPIGQRAQLGSETVDFWSLPTTNLPEDAARRMADVCGKSLTYLRQQVADAGCMP